MEIIFDKKKTFIRKSLNYLLFIIMIAKCQTPGPVFQRKTFEDDQKSLLSSPSFLRKVIFYYLCRV